MTTSAPAVLPRAVLTRRETVRAVARFPLTRHRDGSSRARRKARSALEH